ncbi:MAG: maleylpyruvate isomerase N-terminal domain-containing protein [Pseudonocardia sp.]|nr:maleylpyruvate isomerase N-terminal domain-containing protein [Pseudonocardia sp.]
MGRASDTETTGRAPTLADALRTVATRFAELTRSAPDPYREVTATPGWSMIDLLGHVAMEPSRYRELALGRGEWPSRVVDLPAFNAEQIRTLPSRNVAELTAKLRADTESLLDAVAGFGDDPPLMNFDGDQRVRADLALGTLLGEYVVHGHDIAGTLGRPWPIDPRHVPMIMTGLNQVMPAWVDPARADGHTATYELRLRRLARYVYAFRDGKLTVNPSAAKRVDVHISIEPVTALLMSYRRLGQWAPTLTGKVRAWGRRPWLGTGFTDLFHTV